MVAGLTQSLFGQCRNCGGALSVLAPVALLGGGIFLVVLLQRDFIMRLGLEFRGERSPRFSPLSVILCEQAALSGGASCTSSSAPSSRWA